MQTSKRLSDIMKAPPLSKASQLSFVSNTKLPTMTIFDSFLEQRHLHFSPAHVPKGDKRSLVLLVGQSLSLNELVSFLSMGAASHCGTWAGGPPMVT